MKKITIPKRLGYPTTDIIIGLKTYTLNTGVEIEVEDAIAEAVANALALEPQEDANIEFKKPATIEYVRNKTFFRGWFASNDDIKNAHATPNDYAYSKESGTIWEYQDDTGWKDLGIDVPVAAVAGSGSSVQSSACINAICLDKSPFAEYKYNEYVRVTIEGSATIFHEGKKYSVSDVYVERTSGVGAALYQLAFFPHDLTFAIYSNSQVIPSNGLFVGMIYRDKLILNNAFINLDNSTTTISNSKYAEVVVNGELQLITDDNGALQLKLPALYILWNDRRFATSAMTIDASRLSGDTMSYIIYDLKTKSIALSGQPKSTEWQLCIGIASSQGVYLNALNGSQIDCRYKCAILGSSKTKFIEIDTENKTITFPPDTLAIYNRSVYGLIGGSTTTPCVISYADIESTAINVWINRVTNVPFCSPYYKRESDYNSLLFTLRTSTGICDLSVPYTVNGKLMNVIPVGVNGEVNINTNNNASNTSNNFVEGIAHRGLSAYAPENTLPAFELAKEQGFKYVECDVQFTADGFPVLIHDTTVDRTSNGTGNVAEMTLEELIALDFGSWFSPTYEGTKILTFMQFIQWCRNNGIHPYIEIKNMPDDNELKSELLTVLVEIVRSYGMVGKVTWTSFDHTILTSIHSIDDKSRSCYTFDFPYDGLSVNISALKNNCCDIVLSTTLANEGIAEGYKLPTIVWTVDNENEIKNLSMHVMGVVSNSLDASKILNGKMTTLEELMGG